MFHRWFFMILFSLTIVTPARAEVLATFYSHDFTGAYFPHAFIRLQGELDATGEVIDTNYGFTANSLSPGILFGSVKHKMETKELKYIEKSKPHFTIKLDDAGYAKLLEHVAAWRDIEGKGYNLGKRNCVHFVMEAAALYGLNINRKSKFFKKPKSFLVELMSLNPDLALIEPAAKAQIAGASNGGEDIAAATNDPGTITAATPDAAQASDEAGNEARASGEDDAVIAEPAAESVVRTGEGQTASKPAL